MNKAPRKSLRIMICDAIKLEKQVLCQFAIHCFAENLIRIGVIIPAENNKIQKEFHSIIGYISQNQYSNFALACCAQ